MGEVVICNVCRARPTDGKHKRCKACRDRLSARERDDRAFYKARGICITCHKEKAEEGKTRCLVCKMKHRERSNLSRERLDAEQHEKLRKRERENEKRKKQTYESKGLCVRCGKRKPAEGRKNCSTCLAKSRKTNETSRRKKDVIPRDMGGNGLYCANCFKPVEVEGEKVCARCSGNLERMHQSNIGRKMPENHPWRRDEALRTYENVKRRKQSENGDRRQFSDQ